MNPKDALNLWKDLLAKETDHASLQNQDFRDLVKTCARAIRDGLASGEITMTDYMEVA